MPPIVGKLLQNGRARSAPAVESVEFADYEAAAARCRDGWNDPLLARRVCEDVVALRERMLVAREIPILEIRAVAAVGWVFAEERIEAPLAVLDFGGSAGQNYVAAKACFPGARFRWTVVETAAICAAAAAFANDELRFVTGIEPATKCDLVFSAGAIQYHPRPLELVARLVEAAAPRLALFRTAMSDGSTFCAVQRSTVAAHMRVTRMERDDRETLYPVTFIERVAYRSALGRGYEIVAEIDEGVLNRVGRREVHGYGLLCKRKSG